MVYIKLRLSQFFHLMFIWKETTDLKSVTQSYRKAYEGMLVNDNKVALGLLIKWLTYKDLQANYLYNCIYINDEIVLYLRNIM